MGALRVPVLGISFDGDRYTPHATLDHLVASWPRRPSRANAIGR